jgi:hypothetical protein
MSAACLVCLRLLVVCVSRRLCVLLVGVVCGNGFGSCTCAAGKLADVNAWSCLAGWAGRAQAAAPLLYQADAGRHDVVDTARWHQFSVLVVLFRQ